MIYSPPHFDDPRHPSLYDGLTGWASHAQQRLLLGIAVVGILEWTGLVLLDWRHGPAAGFLLTLSAVAGWGLVEQRAARPHAALTTVAQVLLMILGTIAAVVGGFAWLFWVMGPAPVL
jgi:hypothetical protein